VTGTNGKGILPGEVDHRLIRTRPADKTFFRRLAERQPKLDPWHGIEPTLRGYLDSFNEMRLSRMKLDCFRLFQS